MFKVFEEIGKLIGEGSVVGEIFEYLLFFGEVVEKEKFLGFLDEFIVEKERELNERIEEKFEKFSFIFIGRDFVKFLNELREGNYEVIFFYFCEIEGEIFDMINEVESEFLKVLGFYVEFFLCEEFYLVRILLEVVEGLRIEFEWELKVEVYMKVREIVEKVRLFFLKFREEFLKIREFDFF